MRQQLPEGWTVQVNGDMLTLCYKGKSQAAFAARSTLAASFIVKFGEALKSAPTDAPSDVDAAIRETIGFNFEPGELQVVNANDLRRVFHAGMRYGAHAVPNAQPVVAWPPFRVDLDESQEARLATWVGHEEKSPWQKSVTRLALLLNTTNRGLIDYAAAQHFARELIERTGCAARQPAAQPGERAKRAEGSEEA